MGETPLPSAPRSVFDYLSPKDRERLRGLAKGGITPQPSTTLSDNADTNDKAFVSENKRLAAPAAEGSVDNGTGIPSIDPSIARAALSGFQPFSNDADPGKSIRYTAYLKTQTNPDEFPPEVHLRPALGQSREAFRKELGEFSKAAVVFHPVGGVLGGRFATAKVVERLDGGKGGLFVPSSSSEAPSGDYLDGEIVSTAEEEKKEKEREDPKVNAAKMGMFGILTRSVTEWDPARLLCKRFGMREFVREVPVEIAAATPGPDDWKNQMPSQIQAQAQNSQSQNTEEMMKVASASFRVSRGGDLSNVGLGEDDGQGRDTLTYVRPERDIFKAIFESDEEEEEGEGEGDHNNGDLEGEEIKVPRVPDLEMVQTSITPDSANGRKNETNLSHSGSAGYLNAEASTVTSYIPSTPSNTDANNVPGSVDTSTFRPTFKAKIKGPEKEKSKSKEKDKKKGKGKAILSFEEEGDGLTLPGKPKTKRKKVKKEKNVVPPSTAEEDEMWVEKPLAQAVEELGKVVVKSDTMDVDVKEEESVQQATGRRMRAVDFL